jgi:hypothetical protein
MTDHLFDPWEKLITLVVLGRRFQVPENNLLLRQMQYVAPDIGTGRYCWNAECRYCEIEYCTAAGGAPQAALACRMKGLPGMSVTKAALEIRYNMSEALAAAPAAEPKS